MLQSLYRFWLAADKKKKKKEKRKTEPRTENSPTDHKL